MRVIKLSRKPNAEEIKELEQMSSKCLTLFRENNLPTDTGDAKELAKSVRRFIDMYRENELSVAAQDFDKVNLAYGTGELYAKAIVDTYNWEYEFLEFEDGFAGFAVVSPDKLWCIYIHHYLHNLLHDQEKSNNSLLNYNMLDPQVLQKYKSEGYTSLS
ncbi:hypothetical protein [Pedobacter sp. MC2016-24]|uniref:hypothetical protein n=1 Tax=Pedobacter sp. MC2016-24 TaxID=2780090 RepID=UPI00187F8C33|nr:hypothetical protein [Pedobacter sp. MC2016-24]MBE9597817.1 hypothetical protein [Pedobacter sp. MC2016-24]